jgi:hypothetical protein
MATAAQAVLCTLSATLDAITELEIALDAHFEQNPDAENRAQSAWSVLGFNYVPRARLLTVHIWTRGVSSPYELAASSYDRSQV